MKLPEACLSWVEFGSLRINSITLLFPLLETDVKMHAGVKGNQCGSVG